MTDFVRRECGGCGWVLARAFHIVGNELHDDEGKRPNDYGERCLGCGVAKRLRLVECDESVRTPVEAHQEKLYQQRKLAREGERTAT